MQNGVFVNYVFIRLFNSMIIESVDQSVTMLECILVRFLWVFMVFGFRSIKFLLHIEIKIGVGWYPILTL